MTGRDDGINIGKENRHCEKKWEEIEGAPYLYGGLVATAKLSNLER